MTVVPGTSVMGSEKLGMKRKNILEDMKSTLRMAETILEVAILSLLFYLVWRFWYGEDLFPPYYGRGKIVLIGVYAALIFIGFHLNDCFKFGYLKLTDVLISQWISVFLTNFITYFQLSLIANKMVSPVPLLALFVIDIAVTSICTYYFTVFYHRFYVPHNLLMIYGQEDSLDLKFKMDNREDKYHVTEIISADEPFDQLCEAIKRHDAIIINDIPADLRNDLIKYCYGNRIRTYTAPKVSDIIMDGAKEITLFDTPLRLIKGHGLTIQQRIIKRTVDIIFCLLAMIPFTPIMLIIALAIKLEDHGPVFYKQKRVTRHGNVFEIYKFRSMIVDAEKNNQVIPATGHDPRITKVGRIIRATRLDESAQILNILKGEMSIVGPRPERVEHVRKYCDEIPEFHFREKVKAGLTGYAQVFGKYNTTAYDKLRLDLMYIEHYSLRLDIKLMLMTIRILFTPEATEGFEVQKENADRRKELLKEKV